MRTRMAVVLVALGVFALIGLRASSAQAPAKPSEGAPSSQQAPSRGAFKGTMKLDVRDLKDVLGRNLVPALAVSRAALPVMRARGGGVIAVIASIWGREGGGSPSYNVAKAAEISLAKAMAGDLAKDRIRVFSAAPGSTLFPGGSWERRVRDDPEAMAEFVERELPWGRLGPVEEVADVVTFLVSPRASWVVGTCVVVDGGQSRSF